MRLRVAITGTFKNDRDPRAMEYIPIGYVIGQTARAAGYRGQSARLLIEASVHGAIDDWARQLRQQYDRIWTAP